MRATPSHPNAEGGFSLIEIVVVVGILTIIMGAAFHLMVNSQESYDRNLILAEANQNADFATIRVAELIRGAGSNPNGTSSINSLNFITNKQNDGDEQNTALVRMKADLNGNGTVTDLVDTAIGSDYFLLVAEDVTLQWFAEDTTVNGVDVPANTICLIHNVGDDAGTPIVLAQHIVNFSCPVNPPVPEELTVTIEAGPSRPMPVTDPRYITFTRTMQIRLRNRV
jgi:prepilin-type N-terminal cleavage/methylation domain-containing protein